MAHSFLVPPDDLLSVMTLAGHKSSRALVKAIVSSMTSPVRIKQATTLSSTGAEVRKAYTASDGPPTHF